MSVLIATKLYKSNTNPSLTDPCTSMINIWQVLITHHTSVPQPFVASQVDLKFMAANPINFVAGVTRLKKHRHE